MAGRVGTPILCYAEAVEELRPPTQDSVAAAPTRELPPGRAWPVVLMGTVLPVTGAVTVLIAGPLLAPWLREQGRAGVVLFVLTFALLGGVAFAPTYTTSAIAGWTFGFRAGFPAVLVGTLGGAILCYAGARRIGADRVRWIFGRHPKWEVVRRALCEADATRTLWLVFLLRLSPVLPFGTTNVLLATTGVRVGVYMLGTLLGLIPRMGLVALAAAGAEQLDLDTGESRWLIGMGMGATALLIVVMVVAGKRALQRATRANQPG